MKSILQFALNVETSFYESLAYVLRLQLFLNDFAVLAWPNSNPSVDIELPSKVEFTVFFSNMCHI